MKEYAVHIISNDGTEEHYLGHYIKLSQAKEAAERTGRGGKIYLEFDNGVRYFPTAKYGRFITR